MKNDYSRRKIKFFMTKDYDQGLFDSDPSDKTNPQDTAEGYMIGIIHNHIIDQSGGEPYLQSEILVEKYDSKIISILPKQLICFLDK